ncbi:MAG: glycosyltransferase family 4 protein [Erythrobacter sp.]
MSNSASPSNQSSCSGEALASAEKPNVVFITRKWPPAMGGMETWAKNLAEQLSARSSLELVALPGRTNGQPPTFFSLLLFPFTVLLHRIKRRPTPDLLILGDMAIWPLALLFWPLPSRTKLLIAAHGTDVSYHRRGGIKGRFYGLYLRLGARLMRRAKVIANSRATAEVLTETGWDNSVVVALATSRSDPTAAPKIENKQSDAAHRDILFAGRLVTRKGCGWFVKNVLPNLPDNTRLKVAGTGWDQSEQFVVEHPQVDYLGQLSPKDLRTAYSDADCVIVPNIDVPNGEYEGFGLVAVEAAEAGAMVLASDHGGLRDAVIDGKTGRLIASGDANAWVDAIESIFAMPAEQQATFRQQAQQVAREYYNWDRVAREVLALAEPGK